MAIALLGPLQVDAGGPLEPRDRVALTVLALHVGQVVAPGTFAEAIWGADPPASWPKQVQICVGRLRKILGAAAIQTVPGGYRLAVSEEAVDSCRFERLLERSQALAADGQADRAAATFARALALWRGPPLADVDRWPPARIEAARLEELRRTAEEDLLQVRLAAGEHRAVVAEAEALVAADPLRERRWAVLALSQYRSGRQGDALHSLRLARDTLAERLGVDPGHELTALEIAILRQDPTLQLFPTPVPASDSCPYKGLAAYDVEDGENFFGREADVATCVDRLSSTPILVVAGPSGCGKSSLARAGLVPALQELGRRCAVMVPGDDPPVRMVAALAGVDGPAVLVVDQFEELFALDQPPDRVAAFCRSLVRHAREQAPIVITVRSDYLGSMGVDPGFSRLVEQGVCLVGTLAGDALRAAIERPAALAGLRLEDGLTDLLLRDAEGEAGALPLLSHALAETWRCRDGPVLTVEGYRATGGIQGAVARSAERLHDNLSHEQRRTLRTVLLRLVSTSTAGEPVRNRVQTRSLVGDPGRAQVVTLLVQSRLLTADERTVEVAHEALVRAWPRLRSWLDEDVTGQQILGHLSVASEDWESLGRPDSELLRGMRLHAALDWDSAAAPDLTETERAFLDTSAAHAAAERRESADRAVRDARRNRRLRALLATTTLFLVLSLVAGLLAWGSRRDIGQQRDAALAAQEQAQIEALVNRSLAVRSTDRGVAALLAVEAYRRRPDARSWSALLSTFTAAPAFLGHQYLSGSSLTGTLVPETSTAVVVIDDGAPGVLDLTDGALEQRFAPGSRGRSLLAVSADGRLTARVSWSGDLASCDAPDGTPADSCAELSVYAVDTGRAVSGPLTIPFVPSGLDLSADGSLVAVAGGPEGAATWYRTGDGARVGDLPGLPESEAQSQERGELRFDGRYDTAAVAFGTDGTLFIGSLAGLVRAVDVATGDVVGSVELPPLSSESHLWTTPSGLLVAGGREALAAIDTASMTTRWSVDTGSGVHPETCPWLAVASSVERLYCGSYYGVIQERDLATGLATGGVLDPQNGSVGDLAVSSDGRELVAFGADAPIVSRWRLDGSGPITRLVAPGHVVYDGYDVTGTALLVASRQRGSTVSDDFTYFAVWDPLTDQASRTINDVEGLGWVGRGTLLGFVPDGQRIEYFDSVTGTIVEGDDLPLTAERAWPSGEGVRLYVGFADGDVWTVDVATRRRIGPTIRAGGYPASISATLDGAHVVVTAYEPDGPVTAIYDGASGRELRRGLAGVTLSSVSPNGTLIGATGGQITRYDFDTLAPVATFTAARGEINSMQFSRDGAIVLATSNDQTLSLYDVASGTRLGDPIPTAAPFIVPGFLHPDGDSLAVTAPEGVAIWDLAPAQLLEAACRTAGRNLTRAEWATYLASLGPYRDTC